MTKKKSDVYINNDNVMVLIGYSNKNNEDYKKMYGEQVVFLIFMFRKTFNLILVHKILSQMNKPRKMKL